MKKVLSTIVAALVAVSFSAVVFAADMKSDVKTESTSVTPAGEVKTEKKEVKKSKKTKKGKTTKKASKKEVTTTEPAPAAAPAAK
jgi:Na+/citrate or Na+/malate symporter